MVYTKQTWRNGPDGATPLDAAHLGVIEQGISDAHDLGAPAAVTKVALDALAPVLALQGWAYNATTRVYTAPDLTVHIADVPGLADALAADAVPFQAYMSGTLAVTPGRLMKRLGQPCTLAYITMSVTTPPSGSAIIVDVNRGTSPPNVSTIFGNAANKPTIPVGAYGVTVPASAASVTSFAAGDYLSVDVDAVGSQVAGADLTVDIYLKF